MWHKSGEDLEKGKDSISSKPNQFQQLPLILLQV